MKHLLFFFVLLFGTTLLGQTGIPVTEMSHCDTQALNFMNTFNIPGMSYAVTKDGKLIYMRAFGNANIAETETTQPYHIFRVASVSKPITAIGIMKMIENGTINLTDKVFGVGGLLENHWYFSSANITDPRIYDITVQHLLEHSGGWDRDVNCFPNPTPPYPWFFSGCDPISVPMHVTATFGETNPAQEEHLIRFVLEKTLDHTPGTTYAYSNMGFLILSEIIEEVSGMTYETYMQQQIFHPLGIYDMHIGNNLLADKQEREGEYIGNGYSTYSLYGDGNLVPWEYGGFSVEIMDGHGGWIATARDLVRLLVAVDGFSTKPDILSPATITTMSTASTPFANYAKGWQVNSSNNWWHSGALDGTASYYVRTNGGYTWAIILNKRIIGANANAFWAQLDGLGWNCVLGTTTFPTHDLFESPTVNASSLNATPVDHDTIDLNWTNGNGNSRIVVAKEIVTGNPATEEFSAYPLDGTDYMANTTYGQGDMLSDGSYVVYNGNGNAATMEGLNDDTTYKFRVYEYTKNTVNGNNALYLLGNYTETTATTAQLSIEENALNTNLNLYPNPAKDYITLKYNSAIPIETIVINDLHGRSIQRIDIQESFTTKDISLSSLSKGIYFIKINTKNTTVVKRIIKQ